ncbi:transposase IS200-family protein [Ktedonobacter racemifer DSM 44963]|uniref:Transposase IS200-family protein n=1 Tax=Ktedonobacter racemifer DSM 44963 TaxID=485913 RepID=D6TFB9_KTERA|nr:transposase IS200-family protein [Ktedonobacter racemifer DSM 44963]
MAGKPFSSTKTMKQAVLVRCEQAGWFLATQTLFNQVTSFALRREFPQIAQKLPSLWTRSYFASTAGTVSQQTIQRSLEAQKGL